MLMWIQPGVMSGLYSLGKDIISSMKLAPGWYLVLLALFGIAAIAINELGYGVKSLFLLFPAVWLMFRAFENQKSSD
jgi:hypothetical protein